MINQNKVWTKEEDQILRNCVQKHKIISDGICSAAKVLERSYGSCRNRWQKIKTTINTENFAIRTVKRDNVFVSPVSSDSKQIVVRIVVELQ